MEHLLEVLKILDGALKNNREKVIAYTKQLADKLEMEGNKKNANHLLRALKTSGNSSFSTASFNDSVKIPVDNESRMSLADEEFFCQNDITIYLEDTIQEQVDEFINFVSESDNLIFHGIGVSPTLLTHGPPGCGKTQLAKHIAAELKLPIITARSDSLISSYLGSTAKNLRTLFEHAMSRPCVLFLDEFDAIAKLRDDQYELGELKRVVVSLLQNIDALDQRTILLAATNHEHLLDPAVWRRFAYRIKLNLPSLEVRSRLFNHFLKGFSTDSFNTAFSRSSENLSGSDIRQISEDAKRLSIINGKKSIDEIDVLKRILMLQLINSEKTSLSLPERLYFARNLDSKTFTIRKLSEMFHISTGKISTLLKGMSDGRGKQKITD